MTSTGLPDFKLETFFSRWEFVAEFHLTASDAQSMTVGDVLALEDGAAERYQQLPLGYTPTWGTDELRDAIVGFHQHVVRSDVVTFAGAQEALYWAMQLVVEPTDHVLVTVPNYQSIETVPAVAGVDLEGIPLWAGAGDGLTWAFDLDRVRSLARPTTKLISVNFPNNPTGLVPPVAEWVEFLEMCHDRDIRVVSDEVYRGVERDPAATLPAACDVTPSAISIGVMSKAFGLPGLRIGWAACQDREVVGRLERSKHYTSICNAAPSEMLASIVLRNADAVLSRNRQLVVDNDLAMTEFVGRWPQLFSYAGPDGGCVAFPRYRGADGATEFCRRAVEESGVLLLPGHIYSSELADVPTDRFRVGLGRSDVPAALARLDAHLEQIGAAT